MTRARPVGSLGLHDRSSRNPSSVTPPAHGAAGGLWSRWVGLVGYLLRKFEGFPSPSPPLSGRASVRDPGGWPWVLRGGVFLQVVIIAFWGAVRGRGLDLDRFGPSARGFVPHQAANTGPASPSPVWRERVAAPGRHRLDRSANSGAAEALPLLAGAPCRSAIRRGCRWSGNTPARSSRPRRRARRAP